MNIFLCGLRLDGERIQKSELFAAIARLPRQEWETTEQGAFTAIARSSKTTLRPLIAQHRSVYGVGDVRLDNRAELERRAGLAPSGVGDLEIVLAAIDRHGAEIIPDILGDFAFVAWDARAQKLIAARDAFGVKPLFYRRSEQHLLISSRLEPLCGSEEIDRDYVADFLIGLPGPSPRTIWKDTLQVEPGALLMQRGSVTAQSRYWSARDHTPQSHQDERAAIEEFRSLFVTAVHQRVAPGETWSQLSGGLDSSAVVSTAEWLRETRGLPGLNGTVTITDSLGSGDESRFCDAVIRRYGIGNSLIRDYWPWRLDNGSGPLVSDEPTPLFPFFAREERTVDTVTQGGGRVLLSGLGSDHYMFGTLSYMADLFARGSLRVGAREVLGWAMHTRRSFWHTARLHVMEPLIANLHRRRAINVPAWMRADFARSHHVVDRLADVRSPRARWGEIFTTHTAVELARVANWVQRGPYQDRLEMRYPFLSRPLVEFTLRLPIQMRVRPEGRKWVLREAMRGILPEEVRTRTQKGGMDARVLWALEHERPLLDAMLADPLLGQLGCIDVDELRRTVDAARQGAWHNTVHVLSVLALESWLRARAGAWPPTLVAARTAA